MSSLGGPTTGHSLFFRIGPHKEVRDMVAHLRRFDISSVAKERLKIIGFYGKYGEKATKEAFGVDRKTLYIWRKRLKTKKGAVSSLVPYSTAPKRVRSMLVDSKTVSFIRLLRQAHPRLGKRKIKPLIDEYCRKENLPGVSEAKVGRIIASYKLFYQRQGRLYHNPASGYAKNKVKTKRLRVRYSPKPTDFGYMQMDTVLRLVDGIKYYFYSAVDTKGKFSFSLPCGSLTSAKTLDFFTKLELVYPASIKGVQTDNGLEFLGVFDEYLRKKGVPHYFIYPRCPRINGVIERYQRSLQEEFIDPNLHLIHEPQEFSSKLAQYLIFFNSQRVHQSLNYMTPLNYLLQKGGMSKKYWSRTSS